ncbi:MAG: NAD(P)(+) transhydrogenase (Re/Si-specific) subunit beta [Phycisphaerales bacterium]
MQTLYDLSRLSTLALHKADWLNLVYLLAAVLFYLGLKMLSSVKTARKGNMVSALGMLIAAGATFFYLSGGQAISLVWIAVALAIGTAIGLVLALRVPMTGMPEMVALLNGFGGIASLLVACGDYLNPHTESGNWHALLAIGLATLIGGLTFTGSLVAYCKLAGKLVPDAPVQFAGQKVLIAIMLIGGLVLSGFLVAKPDFGFALILITLLALVLGVLLVIGIGGADMPVVIALLNSYSGIAASMAGFVLNNSALIITGALVGASGIILTNIMCKAMNRSLMNVLFGGVGGAVAGGGKGPQGEARSFNIEDAAIVLDAARLVIIVPGYGMAVAQAQHAVKEFAQQLANRSIEVKYAIHPVAGRMPGHMNVLLAEADVPYEQLLDLEQVNPMFEQADVALVIGANDVTNPAARHDTSSPIYGMPILDVDKARTVFVIKRSMNPGFAGIQNELYFKENTGMIFGDAKKVVNDLTAELAAN